ncbi:DUF554 domain-containing protein [Treponema sp.]|uniref:DUF554 domain-containing protein n=1 Tax=Treponema sp. TaxID=166 RepID=UPI00298E3270|nr:DUF554 domain-containing protein [Treponema sp.]MCR5613134.1 DUF554 domain-containing protein [Treponema sp.]
MIAVFVNCIAVIFGSLIGILFSKKISGKMTNVIQDAAGIITVILGLQMAFQFKNVIYLSLSLLIGGILGSALDIDGKILGIGNSFEKLLDRFSKKNRGAATTNCAAANPGDRDFGHAFLNASCLFCVGAMAILGSFDAGIRGDYTVIITKSILDGFMAITFAASMGIGTLFSFVAILIYQGALTLLSGLLQPFATEQMLAEITGCGGAMIIMIGINLLGLKKIKTANYLPSLLFVIAFVLCDPYFNQLFNFK